MTLFTFPLFQYHKKIRILEYTNYIHISDKDSTCNPFRLINSTETHNSAELLDDKLSSIVNRNNWASDNG
ncbi:unnamed protein product [Callosobruchus maculatus]|uniref:Uncharacterized protein n=1 Tax=Callosobruchus maculatus TaxID=64391 RepID=A0A653BTB5_CALMS|nr:unnamed protein product [Callosobruchus maculatus]